MTTCAFSSAIRTSPGREWSLRAIWFAIVAVGHEDRRLRAPAVPRRAPAASLTVGSSRFCSSPTAASAIARRMPSVGCVAVSDRRSITRRDGTVRRMDLALVESTLAERDEPTYRARQVWEWATRGVASYDEMTTLPKTLRASLADAVPFSTLELVTERESRDGTIKALFRTADGHPVEAVLMRYRDGRRSLCLSSQSGCPLTCTFCATGAMRFGRNLTAWEILDQALHFRRREPVNHAVYMGMGEPFLNVDAVLASAARLPDLGITHRRTTISTVGWMPGLRALRGRGRPADPPRALAPRRRTGEALRAHAGERPLPARGRARRMPPLRRAPSAEGVRRVRDARRRERLSGGARGRSPPLARPAHVGLQGQPDPL